MKKIILILTILILSTTLISCNNKKINSDTENRENLLSENLSDNNSNLSSENITTKDDIKALHQEGSDTMYLSETGSDIVSGNIYINNKFNGDLTMLNSKTEKRFLSLYINNIQTDFSINNKKSIVHELSLDKGENNFKISIDKNINNINNNCVLIFSNINITNDIVPISYITFNLINNEAQNNSTRKLEKQEILKYKVLNKTQDSDMDDTAFEYFNLSLKDYMNSTYDNISNDIKSKPNEIIELPTILSKNSINNDANIKVICNGVEIYSGNLENSSKDDIYIPLKFKAPKDKGTYTLNIVIFDEYNNYISLIRSNDFKLEVS